MDNQLERPETAGSPLRNEELLVVLLDTTGAPPTCPLNLLPPFKKLVVSLEPLLDDDGYRPVAAAAGAPATSVPTGHLVDVSDERIGNGSSRRSEDSLQLLPCGSVTDNNTDDDGMDNIWAAGSPQPPVDDLGATEEFDMDLVYQEALMLADQFAARTREDELLDVKMSLPGENELMSLESALLPSLGRVSPPLGGLENTSPALSPPPYPTPAGIRAQCVWSLPATPADGGHRTGVGLDQSQRAVSEMMVGRETTDERDGADLEAAAAGCDPAPEPAAIETSRGSTSSRSGGDWQAAACTFSRQQASTEQRKLDCVAEDRSEGVASLTSGPMDRPVASEERDPTTDQTRAQPAGRVSRPMDRPVASKERDPTTDQTSAQPARKATNVCRPTTGTYRVDKKQRFGTFKVDKSLVAAAAVAINGTPGCAGDEHPSDATGGGDTSPLGDSQWSGGGDARSASPTEPLPRSPPRTQVARDTCQARTGTHRPLTSTPCHSIGSSGSSIGITPIKSLAHDSWSDRSTADPAVALYSKPRQAVTVGCRQPSSGLRQPSSGLRQPSSGLRQPSSGLRQPSSGLRQPSSDLRQPSSGLRQPSSGLRQPSSGLRQPSSGLRQPLRVLRQPGSGIRQPAAVGARPPADPSQLQRPASDVRRPATQSQNTGSGLSQSRSHPSLLESGSDGDVSSLRQPARRSQLPAPTSRITGRVGVRRCVGATGSLTNISRQGSLPTGAIRSAPPSRRQSQDASKLADTKQL